MVKPGHYQAIAREWTFGKTSKGTEQIAILFEIAEGDEKGQRITWYGFFTEATYERTLDSLENAGWDGQSLKRLDGLGSRPCVIVVENETGQDGKTYPRVRWVNSLGGGLNVKEKMETHEVNSLEERMKGAMLERKQRKGASAPSGNQQKRMREPGEDNDDIGF
jgi:hypothetical protein